MSGRTYRFRLNSQDRFLLLENEMLQGRGVPGLQCQAHVWWEGRVDAEALRRGVERLAASYPAATARLVRTPKIQHVHWLADDDGTIPFEIIEVDDDSDDAVLAVADSTMHRRLDLTKDPPLWFMLLRRPTAGDVLIVPYSHVLMDGKAPEEMFLSMFREDGARPVTEERENEVRQWLGSYRPWRRAYAMSRLMAQVAWARTRGGRITLTLPRTKEEPVIGGMRFHLRTIDAEGTARLRQRVRATLGMESLAPALAASAFRALASLNPDSAEGSCRTYVPVSMRGKAGMKVPIFCNLSTVLPVGIPRAGVADREALVRELQSQMRSMIRSGIDMAIAQAGWWLTERRRPVAWRFVWTNQTWDTSFIFGYHGDAPAAFDRLLGVPVARFYNAMTIADPPGICLSIYGSGGQLHVAVARVDGAVTAEMTEAFLDRFAADLLA